MLVLEIETARDPVDLVDSFSIRVVFLTTKLFDWTDFEGHRLWWCNGSTIRVHSARPGLSILGIRVARLAAGGLGPFRRRSSQKMLRLSFVLRIAKLSPEQASGCLVESSTLLATTGDALERASFLLKAFTAA